LNSLVLVHGLPDHSGTWESLVPLLKPRFPNISLIGLPGIGDSESILECNTFDELADKLAEKLPKGPSIYIGHDFGGILGAVIAERHPKLISQLILINAPTVQVLREAIANDKDQAMRSSYATKIQEDPVGVLTKNNFAFLKYFLFTPEYNLSTDYLNSLITLWSNESTLLNIGHYYKLILNSELKGNGQFNQPASQIWSKGDPFLEPHVQRQMKIKFATHELYSFSHDSHWIQCSDPSRIADIINQINYS